MTIIYHIGSRSHKTFCRPFELLGVIETVVEKSKTHFVRAHKDGSTHRADMIDTKVSIVQPNPRDTKPTNAKIAN